MEKFCEELLYDTQTKELKNQPKKDKAWLENANQFQEDNADASFCKTKWRHLRDSYLREKRTLKTCSDAMLFLDDTLVQEETFTNLTQNESESLQTGMENEEYLVDEALQHPLILRVVKVALQQIVVVFRPQLFPMFYVHLQMGVGGRRENNPPKY
ncbi:hypothetical protein PR048_005514 [Dryococelus australis]|uniref:MADF domain-containing protein n=1 Tax=Dryococelus australis TaxID=614101 RepID=A0ABQ9I8E4_9NEOP|nr:hypothetical protein PR048_005514 [Dryococelus australis]